VAMALGWILDPPKIDSGPLALAVSLVLMGALLALGRHWRRDLFMVTAALGAAIVLATTAFGGLLLKADHTFGGCGSFLLIGLVMVAQVGGAAAWLKALHRERP